MHPVLTIDLADLHLVAPTYRVALVAAALWAVGGTVWIGRRRGLALRPLLGSVTVAAVSAVAGSRLLAALNTATPVFEWSLSGFSIWGAVAGAAVGVWVRERIGRAAVPPASVLADAAVPAAGVAIAVARTGCLCAGCCFGLPTHLPWGVSFPPGSGAQIVNLGTGNPFLAAVEPSPAVHPTQLYDGAAALAAAAVSAWVWRRKVVTGEWRQGSAAAAGASVYAAARAVIEAFRYTPPDVWWGGWGYQALFVVVTVGVGIRIRSTASGPIVKLPVSSA
jgi:phosphatidylglycerol:prolipoprotein diacylglycerol transferase